MPNLTELSRTDKVRRANELLAKARYDPVTYIDRFCYTFDPRRQPYHLPFRLFDYQINSIVKEIKEAIEQSYDIFIEKSRDMGATYTTLDVLLWFWRYVPGSNFLIGSRKEDYVDATASTEISNKEESLFGKLEYTLKHQISHLRPKDFDFRKHMTYMKLVNPENGNVIMGESSNPNFSRSGRFKAILLDEFAFWDHDREAWGATADTTRCRIVLTTPGIKPNTKAMRLRFGLDGEKIKLISLQYTLDPRKDAEWLQFERDRRSPEDFAREILIDWYRSIGGVIYKEFDKEIHHQYFDHELNQHGDYYFGLDFAVRGWTAAVVIWVNTEGKVHVLDEYKEENSAATNHAERIKEMLIKYASLDKYTGYADPSGFNLNQQKIVKVGNTIEEKIYSLADEYIEAGLPIVHANNNVVAGINFVRQKFQHNEIIIHTRCIKLPEELLDYRWKTIPESRQYETDDVEKVRKINDHLCDALRYVIFSKPTAAAPEPVTSDYVLAKELKPIPLQITPEPQNELVSIEFDSFHS